MVSEKYKNTAIMVFTIVLACVLAYMIYNYMTNGSNNDQLPIAYQPQPQQQPEPVLEENPETPLSTGKPTLVLFYGDWCGWSKKILPTWENVKEVLSQTNDVDVLDFEDKRDKEEIEKASKLPGFKGFPDIRFYPNGYEESETHIAYTGDRSEESILEFVYTNQK